LFTLRYVLGLLAAALLLTGTAAAIPDAKRIGTMHLQKIGHVDPHEGFTGDVFGHLGYAYLSSWAGAQCRADGVRVYDMSNPTKPRHVSTFANVVSQEKLRRTWTEKTIVQHVSTPSFKGELAVVSVQGCGGNTFQGFGLYDVTNPADPKELSLVPLDPRGSHEIWLQPRGGHAYVYTAIPRSELFSAPDFNPQTQRASTPGKPDFRIFDVTDPKHPVQVGEWGAWKELGIKPWEGRGHFPANFVHSVITNASATRAFLSYWDLGTVILDISNSAHPRYLGRTPGSDLEGDAHSAALAKNGKVLIETHETFDGRPTLFDISNPARPKKLSNIKLPGLVTTTGFTNGVHDPKVLGNRAYFSWYNRGVIAADISNPRKPKLLAQYLPPKSPDPDHVLCDTGSCRLVWGVYATKSYVLASDMLSGLWVLRLRK
jgi:hypothetical protein